MSEPLTYYHELGSDGGGSFYSVTSSTFIGEVFGAFGLENIADPADDDGFGYPVLSVEFIIEADPDLIFYTNCCGDTPETIAARPGWDSIAAVETGAMYELDDDLASRWGPRTRRVLPDRGCGARRTVRRMSLPVLAPSRVRPAVAVGGMVGARGSAAGGGVLIGPAGLPVRAALSALFEWLPGVDAPDISSAHRSILFSWRLPRVVLGALVGGCLAMSGAAYQGVFRNPLADPFLLGAAAGAGLGATVAITTGARFIGLAAFAGAIVAVAIAYLLGRAAGRANREPPSSWPAWPWLPSSPQRRRTCSSGAPTPCGRCTCGSSAASPRTAGVT
jgi:hypothetical protein